MKSLYLLVNIGAVLLPVIFSFHPKLKFHHKFRFASPAIAVTAFFFIIWDSWFTRLGVWGFNPKYVTGISLFHLPLEEVLFFICIPFACLFTYHSFRALFKINWPANHLNLTVAVFSAVLLTIGLIYISRIYTSITFISTGLLLSGIHFLLRPVWMDRFLSVYVLLIIPFLLVNGILTGTGPSEPVVYYNNTENTGIRMLTIPVEDFVYGFELILLNVFFYEFLNDRGKR